MGLRAPSSDDRMRLSEELPPGGGGYPSGIDRPGLGVGAIVGDSFSIFFRRLHWFAVLSFVPQLLAGVIVVVAIGGLAGYGQLIAGTIDPGAFVGVGVATYALAAVAMVFSMLVPMSLTILAAYDARLGRPFRLRRYLSAGLLPILPLFVCWLVVVVLWLLASTLFIVPGLWVLSVFTVFAPAIVVERAGLGGLGRSIALTKEYRWPILGAMILVMLVAMLIGAVVSLALTAVQVALLPLLSAGGTATGIAGFALSLVLQSFNFAIIYGLPCIAITVIYARLREIKEGAGAESLAEVFA